MIEYSKPDPTDPLTQPVAVEEEADCIGGVKFSEKMEPYCEVLAPAAEETRVNEDGGGKRSKRQTGTSLTAPPLLMKTINIKCDLISSQSYKNSKPTRILHSFVVLTRNTRLLIKEEPKYPIYLPLITNNEKTDREIVISSIGIQIDDFDRNLINFTHQFELVLHLREMN